MKRYLLLVSVSFLFLSILLLYQAFKFSDGRLRVVFCDVGQGDGVYIRTPKGVDITIDAGPNNGKFEKCLASHMPFYDRKIELVFATHPDADHIGGLVKVLSTYKVDLFATIDLEKDTGVFREIESLIKNKKVVRKFIGAGDSIATSDGVKIATFWPDKSLVESSIRLPADTKNIDYNSFSLVQMITFNNFSYLATGDIDEVKLNSLLPSFSEVDVFKLPHHGSRTGINEETFQLFTPKLSIISAGFRNRYGHPHEEVLEELKKYGLKYLRTDEDGEIEVVSDGTSFEVSN